MSKTLEKSISMNNVRGLGKGGLKPQAILCARGKRVETVDWLGRKPCLVEERGSRIEIIRDYD